MKRKSKAVPETNQTATRPADAPAVPVLVRRGPVPVEIKALAQQMLAEGASPEEVVETARARGSGRITEATVKRWLGRYPKLRERARQRQIEAVSLLERRLAQGRDSTKAQLAEAARFAGLAVPPGARSRLDVPRLVELHASMWDSLQRENIALKQRALELEAQKESISRRIDAVRTVVDRMRWLAVQEQLDQLWDVVSEIGAPEKLARPLADTLRNLYRAAGRPKKAGDGGPG
jgi:hypothetical protein